MSISQAIQLQSMGALFGLVWESPEVTISVKTVCWPVVARNCGCPQLISQLIEIEVTRGE